MKDGIDKKYRSLETPCYIIDESKLNNNYKNLLDAFTTRWNNFRIGYSYKTNSLPWVLKYFKGRGCYAEVVSETEYHLALKMGYEKEEIIFNGPYKGFNTLREALDGGSIVNLDSFHEVEWMQNNRPREGKQWKVGLRINFDLEKECQGETIMGKELGRFGFNVENGSFSKAVNLLKEIPYVKVTGIHGHHSTKTKSLNVFAAISRKIVEVAKDIKEDIEYIDMGGCFWGDKPGAPSFKEYADVIVDILEPIFDKEKVCLIMEPGAALIASPVQYLCKAVDKKDILQHRFISTNGSLIHISPQMNGVKLFQEVFASGNEIKTLQILAGFTCIEKDRLGVVKEEREINPGDYILFHNIGAYSMSLSPLFIQYYPNVYVESDNGIYLVRKAWGIEQYISNSLI